MPHDTALAARIADRTAVVGVIGMGYVGLPLGLAIHGAGYKVVGFDLDIDKVDRLNAGASYIRHIPSERISAAVSGGKFEATVDFDRLKHCDIIIICVPTPLGKHREPDLTYVVNTSVEIAKHLQAGRLVVLESTTYPGTTTEVVRPLLDRDGLRSGSDYFLAYSPEREDPGNAEFDTVSIPKVVGGDGPEALKIANLFYQSVMTRTVPVSSTRTAEAVKLTENIFRSVNIALVNELKTIYTPMGIDVWEVIDAAKTKPFGFMPFYPGPGLGGHCIPIDPFYLTWKALEFDIKTRFIELAGEINTDMPGRIVTRLAEALDRTCGKGLSRSTVLLVGMAYKKNVDDLRESPSLRLMEILEARGARVAYHDPFIPSIVETREHPTLAGRRSVCAEEIGSQTYDVALIATDHDDVDYELVVRQSAVVVDTRNVLARKNVRSDKIIKA